MTTNNNPRTDESSGSHADSHKTHIHTPYESIVSQVVTKIKNEPFLFVIAIVALLIGLTVLFTGNESPNLRFIVITITILAILVILGYYMLAVLQMRATLAETRQEAQRYQQQPPGTPHDQPPFIKATNARTDDGRIFTITAPGATIGAIGDHANVAQHVVSTSHPSAGESPMSEAHIPAETVVGLATLLSQHRHNLARLQGKKAVYASGEEPLSLLNQIEGETREIQRIQTILAKHTKDEHK